MAASLSLNAAPLLQACLLPSLPLDAVEIIAATILDAPESFGKNARPIQINGTLLSLSENGDVLFKTARGEFSLKLAAVSAEAFKTLGDLLPAAGNNNKTLTLLVHNDAGKTAALIVAKQEVPTTSSPVAARQTPQETPLPYFIEGKKISLYLLPDGNEKLPWTPTAKTEGQTSPLLKDTETVSPNPFKGEVLTQQKTAPETTAKEPQNHGLQTGIKTGQSLRARIETILPADKPWPSLAEGRIRTEVTGKTQDGNLILSGEGKTFFVKDKGDLPLGGKMLLSFQDTENAAKPLLPLPNDNEWPALRELATALSQNAPDASRLFLHAKIPSPAASLAGTTLFFLCAIQTGKLEEWLGLPVTAAITRMGKRDLLTKIADDLNEASKASYDTRAGEWKSWPLPIHYGQNFDMLRLHVRQSTDESSRQEASRDKKMKTHFVITMNMSRLGPVQLEGLSRPQRLEIVIRSERELPSALPLLLRRSYLQTLEAIGLTGNIGFQTGRQNWVVIEESGMKTSGFTL